MECKICNQRFSETGIGSPLYCTDCNAQIALAAERLTKKSSRRRTGELWPQRIEF